MKQKEIIYDVYPDHKDILFDHRYAINRHGQVIKKAYVSKRGKRYEAQIKSIHKTSTGYNSGSKKLGFHHYAIEHAIKKCGGYYRGNIYSYVHL